METVVHDTLATVSVSMTQQNIVLQRERERWREDVMQEEDLRTSPKLMDRTRAETSCTSSGGKLRVERGDWPAEQQIVSRVHLSSGDDYSFTLELQWETPVTQSSVSLQWVAVLWLILEMHSAVSATCAPNDTVCTVISCTHINTHCWKSLNHEHHAFTQICQLYNVLECKAAELILQFYLLCFTQSQCDTNIHCY